MLLMKFLCNILTVNESLIALLMNNPQVTPLSVFVYQPSKNILHINKLVVNSVILPSDWLYWYSGTMSLLLTDHLVPPHVTKVQKFTLLL